MITSENLRGLTLYRPWPWAMTIGSKRIENRSQNTASMLRAWEGKYVALHAGKTWDYDGAQIIQKIHPEMPPSSDAHPLGIVAIARVGKTHRAWLGWRADEHQALAIEHHRWFRGPYGTVLENVIAIEPVACRGFFGLWVLPRAVLVVVRERWKARVDQLDFLARDASGDY